MRTQQGKGDGHIVRGGLITLLKAGDASRAAGREVWNGGTARKASEGDASTSIRLDKKIIDRGQPFEQLSSITAEVRARVRNISLFFTTKDSLQEEK